MNVGTQHKVFEFPCAKDFHRKLVSLSSHLASQPCTGGQIYREMSRGIRPKFSIQQGTKQVRAPLAPRVI